ncbi:hypothetical protein MW887_008674 [Aspergillus wentii]|nr:hypothetical protein MW887_008674 [Aspergillus wentii]
MSTTLTINSTNKGIATKAPANRYDNRQPQIPKSNFPRLHLLPPGAFDTHVHVFDPKLGPYADGRAYTPEDAPLQKLIAFNKNIAANTQNGTLVLVQPSPYKTDCTVLMHCLQELKDREVTAYAIVVIDLETITDEELEHMHQLGARGIRLNFQADGKEVDLSKLVALLQQAARRISHLPGWMIQLFIPAWTWDVLHDHILALPVTVIADHLGGVLGPSKLSSEYQSSPILQPGFKSLLSLAKQSRVIVKISGLYRMSNESVSNFRDMQSIIQAFAKEIPDQVIWGSDWPHTGDGHNRVKEMALSVKEPFRFIDDDGILRNLRCWMGSEAWEKMVKHNPRRLYH